MSSALFGNAARAASKNLVEFRAGRMHLKGKIVHPDKRKGLVYIYQSDDSLMHFCWKDRTTGSVEEDLIIFPDDCEYRRLTVCTTGRVYVLRFRSTTRRLFFWMQEPKTEKDDDHCRKVNDLLNNPPTAGSHSTPSRSGGGVSSSGGGSGSSSAGGGVLGADLSNLRDSDLHNIIGNISQQQLMQILGSGVPNLSSLLGPNSGSSSGRSYSSSSSSATPTTVSTPTTASTPPPSTPAVTAMETSPSTGTSSSTSVTASSGGAAKSSGGSSSSKEGPIQLADLQNILSGMMGQEGDGGAAGPGVDLSSALTAEALQPILSNPEFVDQLRPLLPATADPLPPAEQLRGTVTSPQFKQAVSIFSHALQSGQLGPLINQFGLGEDAVLAAASADMEAFVKALGKSPKITSGSDAAAKKDSKVAKKDDDDNMAVD